jgi:hypothetical protein
MLAESRNARRNEPAYDIYARWALPGMLGALLLTAPLVAQTPLEGERAAASAAFSRGDVIRGLQLLTDLSVASDGWACFSLGQFYDRGDFGGRDLVWSTVYYRCAARLKYPNSTEGLGKVEPLLTPEQRTLANARFRELVADQAEHSKRRRTAGQATPPTAHQRQARTYLDEAIAEGRRTYAQTRAAIESLRAAGYTDPYSVAMLEERVRAYEDSVHSYAYQMLQAFPGRAKLIQRALPREWLELSRAHTRRLVAH